MKNKAKLFPVVPGLFPEQAMVGCSPVPPPFRVGTGNHSHPAEQANTQTIGNNPDPLTQIPSERITVERSRLGRRSKRKGKTWEREVAAMLRQVFGPHIARGWQSRSGREDCDVKGSPYWIECKHMQLVDLRAALRQAIADTDGRPPVVVAKDDRKPPGWRVGEPGMAPMVVMRLSDWLTLAAQAGPDVSDAERALLNKAGWSHDELITLAFVARRLAGMPQEPSPASARLCPVLGDGVSADG